jgi:hypothetical protein
MLIGQPYELPYSKYSNIYTKSVFVLMPFFN